MRIRMQILRKQSVRIDNDGNDENLNIELIIDTNSIDGKILLQCTRVMFLQNKRKIAD